MTPDDFTYISTLIKSRSGLVLTPDKSYLLESRLMPVARKHGLKGLDELVGTLRARKEEALIVEVTEAMTTNESFFFRDTKPFDLLRDEVLPPILEKRAAKKTLRIWCAAASSGQEPYSIAIILKEMAAKLAGWKIDIVGTDISHDILKKATAGAYSQFEVQRGMPIQMLLKYFEKKDENWCIKEDIRKMVQYRYWNLLDDPKPLGNFDIVFCRNVLIYFDAQTKGKVLETIARMMPEDGMLFLGGAETVLGVTDKFKPVAGQRGVYSHA
ncbi:MAG: protein-glutamate O-methyltransferase [Alphaproteobacteria bacterium]|nr:protein-glutamate O-methyltransferase [Alphaproteobacteria bacterium]MBF0249430.1 protein-glutamate O-methyltransferase [Alphaproteobacteria bacterium]